MKITPAPSLPEILVFEPTVHGDERGFFVESFRDTWLAKAGIEAKFVQDNQSRSRRFTLRGLHWQGTHPQGKLVRWISLIVWGHGSAMSRVLNHPLLRWNGRLSYSFYLWHYFILTMAVRVLYLVFTPGLLHRYEVAVCGSRSAWRWRWRRSPYSFIERPFIEFGRRLAAQWQQRARPQADTIVDLAAP
jgi:hypothetical protein